jgi:hypothetical protein
VCAPSSGTSLPCSSSSLRCYAMFYSAVLLCNVQRACMLRECSQLWERAGTKCGVIIRILKPNFRTETTHSYAETRRMLTLLHPAMVYELPHTTIARATRKHKFFAKFEHLRAVTFVTSPAMTTLSAGQVTPTCVLNHDGGPQLISPSSPQAQQLELNRHFPGAL